MAARVWLGYPSLVYHAECGNPPRDGDLALLGCASEAIGKDPYGGLTGGSDDAPGVAVVAAWVGRNPTAVVYAKKGVDKKSAPEWFVDIALLLGREPAFPEAWVAAVNANGGSENALVGNKPFLRDLLAGLPGYSVVE